MCQLPLLPRELLNKVCNSRGYLCGVRLKLILQLAVAPIKLLLAVISEREVQVRSEPVRVLRSNLPRVVQTTGS